MLFLSRMLNVGKIPQSGYPDQDIKCPQRIGGYSFRKGVEKYSSEKLKHIENRLKPLPEQEQQRILDIMDSAITIELDYYSKRG